MDPFLVVQWVLRIVLAVLFVAMGALHFVPKVQRGMGAMIPPGIKGTGIRSPRSLVLISGVAEIAGGLGLLAPWDPVRFAAGIGLIALLIAVFPANAYAARHRDRFGVTAVPLVPRAIGQVVLGALVLLAVI